MHIELSVSGQRLRREMGPGIVGGSRYYLTAHVAFAGHDWDGAQVWLRIDQGDAQNAYLLDADGCVTADRGINLPAGQYTMSLLGLRDAVRITTNEVPLCVLQSGADGGEPLPEIPQTAAEQIALLAQEAVDTARSVREDADAGRFDGEDGVSVTHQWDGSVLTITSASGTSSADLRGPQGPEGKQGPQGPEGQAGKDAPQDAVRYGVQALDEAQQAIARDNIGAASAVELRRVKDDVNKHGEALDNRIKKFYTSNLGAVSVPDSDDGQVRNLVIGGKSEQRTTNGYQMINQVIPSVNSTPQISIDTIDNGFVIATLSEGVYRQNGAYISPSIVEAGNYTVSAKVSGAGGIIFRFFGSGGEKLAEKTISSSNESDRIEIGEKCEVRAVLLGCHGSAVDIGTITTITDIMLEPGDMAHEWEPYTGGAPSPSPDYPQEIKSVESCSMTVSSTDGTQSRTAVIPVSMRGIGNIRDELYVYGDGTGKLVQRYPDTLDPTKTVAEQALEEAVETVLTAGQVQALFGLRTYYGGTNITYASDNGVEPVVNFDYACALDAFVEYVKAQQGDTREMIYDMDDRLTQAEVTALEAAIDAQIAQAMMEV